MTEPSGIPARADSGDDDPRLRGRAARIAARSADTIRDAMGELAELGLVQEATVDVRVHRGAPHFKLYVLNGADVFFGFYPIVRHQVTVEGKRVAMYDVLGKDVPLMHFALSDDETSESSQYVEEARRWFGSVWSTIAREPAT